MPTPRWETTSTELLDALHNPEDDGAWQEFDRRYRPVLVGVGRRLGLQADDAADAAQETILSFIADYRAGKYVRGRGRLGAWLAGICRHRVIDQQRASARRGERRGDSVIGAVPDGPAVTRIWEDELHRRIFAEAMRMLREETGTDERTIDIFERTALRAVPPATVAEEFDIEPAEVYRIKHRVAARLRELVERIGEAYTTEP